MFKNAIKDDLQFLALELDIEINGKTPVYELNQTIKNYEKYKEDPNAVNDLATSII